MPQSYTQEFKKKIAVSMRRKDVLTKASLLNTAFPKPVSPSDAASYKKNARQARKQKINILA